jgi:16S rRNA (cytosine1402-N4)-methyltransferase
VKHNFRFLKNFLRYHGFKAIDGLIADLGVSSHHFDTPHRGFSFRFNSNLDMRMNTQSAFSAKELINTYSIDDLTRVFRAYGELKNARKLAFTIHQARQSGTITETSEFVDSISACIPRHNENQYLAKVFQALRIEVNKEIDQLKSLLLQVVELLKIKGRVAVISYHSLEDRVVKNFFRSGNFEGIAEKDLYGNIQRQLIPVNNKVIVPSALEIEQNGRARSARLRIAEKK